MNTENKIWIDIFKTKYFNWHPWHHSKPSHSSWFFKSICNAASFLKTNLSISYINPDGFNWMRDPWLLDTPISKKPTYLNMNLDLENFLFKDFLRNNSLCLDYLTLMFGDLADLNRCNKLTLVENGPSLWVWSPPNHMASISFAVYDHISTSVDSVDLWNGWKQIWQLCVIPRVKTFIW